MGAVAALWSFVRTPLGGAIALAFGFVAVLWWIDHRARIDEAAQIEAKIANGERKSLDEARSGLDDVRRCADAGGVWDGTRGACGRRLP
mgnify:CR=1 FL=1